MPEIKHRAAMCQACFRPGYASEVCQSCGASINAEPSTVPCPECGAKMLGGSGYCWGCCQLVDA